MHPYFGDGRCLLIAHRGGAARWPENTLLAFENAYALGYRWIETDVHLTKDGEIVVFHDERLERTTDGTGRTSDHTLTELKRLDAGHQFFDGNGHPFRGCGVRIPTLEEAFAVGPELRLNLEMKGQDPRLAEALHAFADRHDVHHRMLAASGHDPLTAHYRSLGGTAVPTSPGVRGILKFWLSLKVGAHTRIRWPFDVLQVPIAHEGLRVVDQRFVDAAHAVGLKVHVWTINDAREMRWLYELGVDGIMTDRPQVLLETLDAIDPTTGHPRGA